MKPNDLFCCEIMQIMFRAKSMSPPDSVQKFVSTRESEYDLRGVPKFIVQKANKAI